MLRNRPPRYFTFSKKTIIAIGLVSILTLFVTYTYLLKSPSHDRNWETGLGVLPKVELTDKTITIQNIRNFSYAPGKLISQEYIDRTIDLQKVERVWFAVEPFEGFPLISFNGIAHTYFIFDIKDEKPIVVSVEARKEQGEAFGLIPGILNDFELIYLWGTEDDLTVQRILVENNSVYMYPLTIVKESSRRLFEQMARSTHELEKTPRFYNTLTSNCTNELAKNANASKPGSIPFNLTWFLPGFAPQELYRLGFIQNDIPLDEVSKKYYISDMVKDLYDKPDFSERLREGLQPTTPAK